MARGIQIMSKIYIHWIGTILTDLAYSLLSFSLYGFYVGFFCFWVMLCFFVSNRLKIYIFQIKDLFFGQPNQRLYSYVEERGYMMGETGTQWEIVIECNKCKRKDVI